MAYTVSKERTVFGNKSVVGIVFTADTATQTIETGLGRIDWMSLGVISAASMGFKCAINSNASGVEAFGSLGLSGLAAGDKVCVTVYGG